MFIIEDKLIEGTTTPVTGAAITVKLSMNGSLIDAWIDATLSEDDTTKRYVITSSGGDIVWKSAYEETALRHVYESLA